MRTPLHTHPRFDTSTRGIYTWIYTLQPYRFLWWTRWRTWATHMYVTKDGMTAKYECLPNGNFLLGYMSHFAPESEMVELEREYLAYHGCKERLQDFIDEKLRGEMPSVGVGQK